MADHAAEHAHGWSGKSSWSPDRYQIRKKTCEFLGWYSVTSGTDVGGLAAASFSGLTEGAMRLARFI